MPEIAVLIVEDDTLQRRQMMRVLRAEGYRLAESATGKEAMVILKKEKVDLVLTDKLMPDMDGLTLLKDIRENYPRLPVIIMTGQWEEKLDPEPDALLVKPFSSEDLRSLIKRLLANS